MSFSILLSASFLLLRQDEQQKQPGAVTLQGTDCDAQIKAWFIETGRVPSPRMENRVIAADRRKSHQKHIKIQIGMSNPPQSYTRTATVEAQGDGSSPRIGVFDVKKQARMHFNTSLLQHHVWLIKFSGTEMIAWGNKIRHYMFPLHSKGIHKINSGGSKGIAIKKKKNRICRVINISGFWFSL